jgi:hypothetical protein
MLSMAGIASMRVIRIVVSYCKACLGSRVSQEFYGRFSGAAVGEMSISSLSPKLNSPFSILKPFSRLKGGEPGWFCDLYMNQVV